MRVCLYSEPWGGALGGGEVSIAILGEALAREHEVEILHHRPQMDRRTLSEFADVNLDRVQFRYVERLQSDKVPAWRVFSRYRREQRSEAALSHGFDVLISFIHNDPLNCAARVGVGMSLFPFAAPEDMMLEDKGLLGGLRWFWRRWKFRRRVASYQVWLANSDFTRKWTRRRWRVDCGVVYPPIDVDFEPSDKQPRILSVGRFATGGHCKNQIEMLQVFGRLRRNMATPWDYACVGGCGTGPSELAFFERARTCGQESGAMVESNLSRAKLRELYRGASIFWHAAGMSIDEEQQPELAEHFGMSTAEAMAAGCVPVVINKGGQKEIVEHGVSGFVWQTPEELEEYTQRLMDDPALRERMSAAARERAQLFSREAYVARFLSVLSPHLAGCSAPLVKAGLAEAVS